MPRHRRAAGGASMTRSDMRTIPAGGPSGRICPEIRRASKDFRNGLGGPERDATHLPRSTPRPPKTASRPILIRPHRIRGGPAAGPGGPHRIRVTVHRIRVTVHRIRTLRRPVQAIPRPIRTAPRSIQTEPRPTQAAPRPGADGPTPVRRPPVQPADQPHSMRLMHAVHTRRPRRRRPSAPWRRADAATRRNGHKHIEALPIRRTGRRDTPMGNFFSTPSYPHSCAQMWVNPVSKSWITPVFAVDASWITRPGL